MKRIFIIAIFALPFTTITTLNSCTSVNKITAQPLHAGVSRTFSAPFNSVLKAAREAIVESGLTIESFNEVSQNQSIIIGRKSVDMWSYGSLVRVIIEKQSERESIVRVLTEKNVKINVTGKGDYSQSILSNIELKLKN